MSHGAIVNYQNFAYNNFYLIRVEITDTDAEELKQRFLLSRYIIILIELEATIDIIMRIYLAVCQTKNLKTAKDEVQSLTEGIQGIRSVTFNLISLAAQKAFHLDEKDVIK